MHTHMCEHTHVCTYTEQRYACHNAWKHFLYPSLTYCQSSPFLRSVLSFSIFSSTDFLSHTLKMPKPGQAK